ncbi:MAG TPA: hypothetical protein PLV85_22355, partial [Polyangiaceae bacterium]|nr:hypothetical protein [Polyangiaceae bacterium]
VTRAGAARGLLPNFRRFFAPLSPVAIGGLRGSKGSDRVPNKTKLKENIPSQSDGRRRICARWLAILQP